MVNEQIEDNNIDAKQIEQDLLKKEEQRLDQQVVQQSPVEAHAKMFAMYSPIFKNGVNGLSSRKLKKLINYLIEFPLNSKEYRLMTQMERDLFNIGNKLLESKFCMRVYIESEKIEEAQKKLQAEEESAKLESNVDSNEPEKVSVETTTIS